MKPKTTWQDRDTCLKACEDEFIRYTARKPVGGAEMLRVCRTTCPEDAPKDRPEKK